MFKFRNFCLCMYSSIYPTKVYGKDKVPEGRCILVCNHLRATDPAIIASVYKKDIYFMAKKELFNNKLLAKIITNFGSIPVDRDNPDIKSLMQASRLLKNDHKLAIFPEGTRNKVNTDLQELKPGTGLLAVRTKSPVLPIMMLKRSRPFIKTKALVGDPIYLTEFYDKKLTDEDHKRIDEIIREKMLETQVQLKEMFQKKKKDDSSKK